MAVKMELGGTKHQGLPLRPPLGSDNAEQADEPSLSAGYRASEVILELSEGRDAAPQSGVSGMSLLSKKGMEGSGIWDQDELSGTAGSVHTRIPHRCDVVRSPSIYIMDGAGGRHVKGVGWGDRYSDVPQPWLTER